MTVNRRHAMFNSHRLLVLGIIALSMLRSSVVVSSHILCCSL